MKYILVLLLLFGCSGYKITYRVIPVTYYKYDSIKTRDYMLEVAMKDRYFGKWSAHLIEPEMMLPEEKQIYDSLMLDK